MPIRELLMHEKITYLDPKFTILNKVIKNEDDFEIKKEGIELYIKTNYVEEEFV